MAKRKKRKTLKDFVKEIRLETLRMIELRESGRISGAKFDKKMDELDDQLNFVASIVVNQ